jgi:quercetin dioxygenase-like cupin family protein
MVSSHAAEVVLGCTDFQATLDFFIEQLGFRLESIFPADDPSSALLSAHGLKLRLERGLETGAVTLRLLCADPDAAAGGSRVVHAPNGTRIEWIAAQNFVRVPTPQVEFLHTRTANGARWSEGRAGMRYRDLLPGRLGGFLVASQIRIDAGGTVSDYVHYHDVRFQLIYCRSGWVRVVYEDQGPAFVLEAGDCVLQPPRIRHRVLECSPGLEVIELTTPSAHPTFVDHELSLPTGKQLPERDFCGQRFVHHKGASATWRPGRARGFEYRDLGILAASAAQAQVQVARVAAGAIGKAAPSQTGFRFVFVLQGSAQLSGAGEALQPGDALLFPAESADEISASSADLQLLEATFL